MAPDSLGTDQDFYWEVRGGIVFSDLFYSRLFDGGVGDLCRQDANQESSISV